MRIADAVRITFRDAELEADYRTSYWNQWLPYARVGMLSAAFLGAAFGLLDHLVAGYAVRDLFLIRFGVLVPIIVIGFCLSFIQNTSSHYHIVVIVCLIIVGVCIISMISVISPPASDYYYAGLIMVLFFNYTLLQLRLPHAVFAGTILVLVYGLVTMMSPNMTTETFINNSFFIIATTYGGIFACYTIERSRRENFEQFKELQTEREKLRVMAASLQEISNRDDLTGLFNRRYLQEYMQRIERSDAIDRSPLSLILIDVDDFKNINDKYGHNVGDEVLKNIAIILSTSIADNGLAFRYGGDEFIVLAPHSNAPAGLSLARGFAAALKRHSEQSVGFRLPTLTVSIGITEIESRDDSFVAVMQRADAALYTAKMEGKARIEVYSNSRQYMSAESL